MKKLGLIFIDTDLNIEKKYGGGLLADEMGLGKTLQIISMMIANPKPLNLIVCPASLVKQWETEINKFAPSIKVWNKFDDSMNYKDDINVIVSDGFTGNVALKTAEGTANFITSELKKAMTGSILGKISSFLNVSNLKKFKNRLDPRLYNGAIFIGLDSPVVKSHGGTDYIGFSNSLDVCNRIVKGNLIEKIKQNI